MPISRIGTDGIEAGAVAPSDLSTGGPSWDGSGNVGIGTSSPRDVAGYVSLGLNDTTGGLLDFYANGTRVGGIVGVSGSIQIGTATATPLIFNTDTNERARIDSSGRLMVNTTVTSFGASEILSVGAGAVGVVGTSSTSVYSLYIQNTAGSGASSPMIRFSTSNGVSGTIISTSTSTTYATSSDYRLKENVQPMTGALAKVASLKPVTYTWKADNSEGEGFIAHELQEVCPDAVTGQRDEVDADGNPVYQGIDTSFLVATLTAAIQEQQQMIETLQAKIAALEAK